MAVETMTLRPNDTPTVHAGTSIASQTSISLDPLAGAPVDASIALASRISISRDPLSGAPVVTNKPVARVPATMPQHRRDDVGLTGPPPSTQSDLSPSHPIQLDPTTTPGRPLQVPESLQSVIERAVTEQLSLNSNQIVDSTVRGVLDACIPRLEAFIDAKVTSVGSKRTTKGSRVTRVDSEGDGWEGDDETVEDQLQNHSKGRKKPGPRGHKNFLHVRHVLKP